MSDANWRTKDLILVLIYHRTPSGENFHWSIAEEQELIDVRIWVAFRLLSTSAAQTTGKKRLVALLPIETALVQNDEKDKKISQVYLRNGENSFDCIRRLVDEYRNIENDLVYLETMEDSKSEGRTAEDSTVGSMDEKSERDSQILLDDDPFALSLLQNRELVMEQVRLSRTNFQTGTLISERIAAVLTSKSMFHDNAVHEYTLFRKTYGTRGKHME
eukprot:gene3833-4369_t